MRTKQDLYLTGDLDLENDLKNVKAGDYVTALNFRNVFTVGQIDGSGENVYSNSLVAYELPSGTNKCVGAYEDQTNNTVFYWIWNSGNDHQLLRYYPNEGSTGEVQEILSGSILGLTEWNYVTHYNLVGELLYWVEGDNPQRKININKANNTDKIIEFKICFGPGNQSGVSQQVQYQLSFGVSSFSNTITFGPGVLTRAQAAQVGYTQLMIWTDFTDNFTLENKGEYLLATAKAAGIWTIVVNPLGTLDSWYKAMNWYPTVTLKTLDVVAWPAWGDPDTSLFFDADREINLLNRKSFQFRTRILYEDGEVSTLSPMSRMVYNTTTSDAEAIYDYVNYDQLPSALNGIAINYDDGDRIFGNRELIKSIEIFVRNTNTELFRSAVLLNDYELDGAYNFFNDTNGSEVGAAESAKQYQSVPINSKGQEVVSNILFYTNNLIGYDNTSVESEVICISDNLSWDNTNIQRPKYFASYRIGIVYYDRFGRNNFVQNPVNIEILPPSVVSTSSTQDRPYVSWLINSQPPEWAVKYSWVRTKDLVHSDYTNIQFNPATAVYYTNEGIVTSWATANVYSVELSVPAEYAYDFTQGDLCRLVFFNSGSPFAYNNNYVVNVLSYDPATEKLILSYPQQTNAGLVDLKTTTYLVRSQIYTPYSVSENETYYEFYETYGILDAGTSNRRHSGGFEGQNQITGTQPATGFFYYGWDTFHNRNLAIPAYSFLNETLYPTIKSFTEQIPLYSAISGIGRPTAVNPENRQVRLGEDIAFSDVYNIGTAYNGFGTWELLNHESLPIGYGSINLLKNVDNVLVAVATNKAFSIYIKQGVITAQDGSTVISQSDAVIGGIRQLNGLYGTVNPESFAVNDNLLFWWDVYRGIVCQYSSQGIEEISKYKARTYFANKGRLGLGANLTQYKVLGVVHKPFKEYVLSFPTIEVNEVEYPAETLAFNYATNGWKTRYPFIPEIMVGSNTNFLSFKNGALWQHGPKSGSRNTFYGVEYPLEVTPVVNQFPDSNKSFLSVSMESKVVCAIPEIITPVTDFNLSGQESELAEGDFEFMNGSYWAPFLMNKLSPNFDTEAEALISGEQLQSQVMTLLVRKETDEPFWVKALHVYFIQDPLTN